MFSILRAERSRRKAALNGQAGGCSCARSHNSVRLRACGVVSCWNCWWCRIEAGAARKVEGRRFYTAPNGPRAEGIREQTNNSAVSDQSAREVFEKQRCMNQNDVGPRAVCGSTVKVDWAHLYREGVFVRRCGVVGSTLAFGFIGHGFESEHRLFSHHSASAFSKLR